VIEGSVADIAIIVELFTPELAYSVDITKVVLTMSKDILSHSFLAAAERGLNVVGNIDEALFKALSDGDKISIDFNQKKFLIKLKKLKAFKKL